MAGRDRIGTKSCFFYPGSKGNLKHVIDKLWDTRVKVFRWNNNLCKYIFLFVDLCLVANKLCLIIFLSLLQKNFVYSIPFLHPFFFLFLFFSIVSLFYFLFSFGTKSCHFAQPSLIILHNQSLTLIHYYVNLKIVIAIWYNILNSRKVWNLAWALFKVKAMETNN